MGLCPFHNEKTPSFTVSPAKGIYKCFGCGKGGHSVDFIMQVEQLSFPEAIRYLGKKYNIEIEEKELSPEQKVEQSERENLFVVLQYAQKYFTKQLLESEEGRSIGLSYFKERGFSREIVERFQMGYSPEKRNAFTVDALANGYNLENLVKAGLSIKSEGRDPFDRFAARVMFPIHNIAGRVIGFGGRTLKSDKTIAKYFNSPESEVYHKSNVLYGLYFAKKSIVEQDNCFLVEGYTDVISLHQAGIENVVASSGTSLTIEQIRLIRRYTPNITILYDGDNAGIKASFRGINLILEEGMNVKVLLFPEGEDPDSFSRKTPSAELKAYIAKHAIDFVSFKTKLLYDETANDPLKKAGIIKDIVETIALIPDAISQSVFIKETSRILQIDEQVLILEVNKLRRKKNEKEKPREEQRQQAQQSAEQIPEAENKDALAVTGSWPYEKEIIRLLIEYGQNIIKVESEEDPKQTVEATVADTIHNLLTVDYIVFEHEPFQKIFHFFSDNYVNKRIPTYKEYVQNQDPEISNAAIEVVSTAHQLSPNWERHNIDIVREEDHLKPAVYHSILTLKTYKVQQDIEKIQHQLKLAKEELDLMMLLQKQKTLIGLKQKLAGELGRIILK
jgi:DNA primase